MGQERHISMDDQIPLREYLLAAVRQWYLVVIVFVIVLAIAVALPHLQSEVFEARTKLLIVPPLSERVLGEEGNVQNLASASLSVDTLSALATANDLLQTIIIELDLQDSTTGRPWAPERLAQMMNAKVETGGQGGAQTSLPLLTMTIRGDDPRPLKRIADAWAEAFVQENSELFKTEAARSYQFVASRYDETRDALRAKQQEKLDYEQANPLASLQGELDVLTRGLVDTPSLQRALAVQLENDKSALTRVQAQLESAEEALAAEPQFLTLERSISNDAIWQLLVSITDPQVAEVIPTLKLTDQEINELHFALKGEVAELRSEAAALEREIAYLNDKTEEVRGSIEELSSRIATIELNLSRFDQEITVLTNSLDSLGQRVVEAQIASAEQAGSIRVVESAVEPQAPVSSGQPFSLPLAGFLGLFLGVGLAMFVHYLQGPQDSRQ